MTGRDIAIRARGLCKAYRRYKTPFDAVLELATGLPRHTTHTVLNDINLDLHRGEIIGVLGRNGAGKSTLLKVIAGTLDKTAGELEVNGRITAILELGTGFHPEYTGRENIFMGGMCLGMTRREIESKIASIIDFSELREVIDEPFKTYSTGMQARLTFSTAISVDPEILIVDEALSVGDARFQSKCFSRLLQLRQKNLTILLVSHDTNTITSLCDRALLLEGGKVYIEGDSKQVSLAYHNLLFGQKIGPQCDPKSTPAPAQPDVVVTAPAQKNSEPVQTHNESDGAVLITASDSRLRYGSGEATLAAWGLFDEQGKPVTVIESGKPCRFSLSLMAKSHIADLSVGFAVKDRRGTVLWGITNLTDQGSSCSLRADEILTVSAHCVMWLAAGDYFVTLGAAHLADGEKIDFVEDAIEFRVQGPGNIFTTAIVNLQTTFDMSRHPKSLEAQS